MPSATAPGGAYPRKEKTMKKGEWLIVAVCCAVSMVSSFLGMGLFLTMCFSFLLWVVLNAIRTIFEAWRAKGLDANDWLPD